MARAYVFSGNELSQILCTEAASRLNIIGAWTANVEISSMFGHLKVIVTFADSPACVMHDNGDGTGWIESPFQTGR